MDSCLLFLVDLRGLLDEPVYLAVTLCAPGCLGPVQLVLLDVDPHVLTADRTFAVPVFDHREGDRAPHIMVSSPEPLPGSPQNVLLHLI